MITCPGSETVVTKTEAGGAWLNAPASRGYAVTGGSFSGTYSDGATLPSIGTWQVHRVE